jgi:hypothetical protein
MARPFIGTWDIKEKESLMIMHLSANRLLLGAALLAGTLQAQHASIAPLFQLTRVQGACHVRRPGDTAFAPAIDNKAYPFGTAIQTGPAGSVVIAFTGADTAIDVSAVMGASTEVRVERAPDASTNRIIILLAGEIQVLADRDTPAQALAVAMPDYTVSGFTGRAVMTKLPATADLGTTRVSAVKGGLIIAGSQFAVSGMRAGCTLRIEAALDRSLTRITPEDGETVITLDNGTPEPLLFSAVPNATVKIWREYAPIGGRLIVAVFAVGPDGKHPECYAFSVGRDGLVAVDAGDIEKAAQSANPPAATPPASPTTPIEGTPAPDANAGISPK